MESVVNLNTSVVMQNNLLNTITNKSLALHRSKMRPEVSNSLNFLTDVVDVLFLEFLRFLACKLSLQYVELSSHILNALVHHGVSDVGIEPI